MAAATWCSLLFASAAAQDVCTLETDFKDDDFPCRKWLHCRQPSDWTSLSTEIKTKSENDRLCAIVVDCANTLTISNFDFQAIGGGFDRVLNVTISRCNATTVRLADDMYFVVEVDLNGNAVNSLDFMQQWKDKYLEEFEILHFHRNTLSSVRKSDFAEFYQLTEVRLDSNLIVDVEAGSFDKNQRLQSISLANNRIENLQKDMFRDIEDLKIVELSANKITGLDAGVFVNIHLQSLDLSHNDIPTVPNSVFVDTSVVSLNLSNCRIRNIPSGFLSSLRQNLTTLDLSNNDIGSVTFDAFVHLSQLRMIFLTGNKLATIEQSMFPQDISEIHIKSDAFRCCHLLWLQTLMKGTSSGDDVMCVYPFAARLSQYLNSSFDCAEPEVFPIAMSDLNTTTTQATCVARGVPAPNVTLTTGDGAYVADAVGGISDDANTNVSISLTFPNTDVLRLQLVCIAVNIEGTRQVSLWSNDTDPTTTSVATTTPPASTLSIAAATTPPASTLSIAPATTTPALQSCTLQADFKDDDFPCRKWLHCRQPSDWTSLSREIKSKSENDRLCAIVIDCANTLTISNFDFQAIGGGFDRVLNVTISRCNATTVRLAEDMYFVVEVDLNGNAFDSLAFMDDWTKEDIEVVHLPENKIRSVRGNDFSGMTHLHDLNLESNLIENIDSGSFRDNQRLQMIDLANNRLQSVGGNMFRDLTVLKKVRLAGNRISHLDPAVFVNVHLDSLDLSRNDIPTVPNSVFVDASVVSLNLSNCRIGNVPSGFLSSLGQILTTLDLSNNNIESLTSDAFVHLSQLRMIFLTGNKLATIEQSMFPQGISEIHIKSDSFRCCHLLWLQTMMKGTTSGDDIMCVYPFASRLSQYLSSSFDCAAPEVFPIATSATSATSTKATCEARGVPTPNVTLMTVNGPHVAEAVTGSPGKLSLHLNVSVNLILPNTDAHMYRLVCIAVNAEGTRKVSLLSPTGSRPPTPTTKPPNAATTTLPVTYRTTEDSKRSHGSSRMKLVAIFVCVWLVVLVAVVLVYHRYRSQWLPKSSSRVTEATDGDDGVTPDRNYGNAELELAAPPGDQRPHHNVNGNPANNVFFTTLNVTLSDSFSHPRSPPPQYTSLPDVCGNDPAFGHDYVELDTIGDWGSQTALVTAENGAREKPDDHTGSQRGDGGATSRIGRYLLLEPMSKET